MMAALAEKDLCYGVRGTLNIIQTGVLQFIVL